MCIICIKPEGKKLPKDKVIRTMFENNSNGAGFAYRRKKDEQVTIEKGYFDATEFIKELRKRVSVEHTAVIHFRLATSGAVDGGNCHPFPAVRDVELMRETSAVVPVAVAHNGVFSMPDDKIYSDTMLWISSRLAHDSIIKNLHHSAVQHLINDSLGTSKLAVLASGTKNVLMFGHWEHDKGTGLYYSNGGYKQDKEQYWNWRKKVAGEMYTPAGYDSGYTTWKRYGDACEMCGRWSQETELVEYEDMMLCDECFQKLRQAGQTPALAVVGI